MSAKDKRIGSILVAANLITAEDLDRAIKIQAISSDRFLGEILVGNGALSMQEMIDALHEQATGTDAPRTDAENIFADYAARMETELEELKKNTKRQRLARAALTRGDPWENITSDIYETEGIDLSATDDEGTDAA